MTDPRQRRAIHRMLALIAAAGIVAGCGDDDLATAEPTADQTDESTTVEITAVDYAFDDVPATIDAGSRLTLVNESSVEIHELVAFRLPDDDERSIDEIASLPPQELLALVGPEPATVLLAPPAGDVIPAVGDGTLVDPGRYALICVIPTGADPDEYLRAAAESEGGPPEVDGGPPHIAAGMYAELVVE